MERGQEKKIVVHFTLSRVIFIFIIPRERKDGDTSYIVSRCFINLYNMNGAHYSRADFPNAGTTLLFDIFHTPTGIIFIHIFFFFLLIYNAFYEVRPRGGFN